MLLHERDLNLERVQKWMWSVYRLHSVRICSSIERRRWVLWEVWQAYCNCVTTNTRPVYKHVTTTSGLLIGEWFNGLPLSRISGWGLEFVPNSTTLPKELNVLLNWLNKILKRAHTSGLSNSPDMLRYVLNGGVGYTCVLFEKSSIWFASKMPSLQKTRTVLSH